MISAALSLLLALSVAVGQDGAQAGRDAGRRCAGTAASTVGEDWRRMASDADRARLRNWRDSWTAALAGRTDHADAALFDPDRARDGALPPVGAYRCRLHRLGVAAAGAAPWGGCRVEDEAGRLRLVVEDGPQRPVGYLYPDSEARAVFLGTVLIGDEARPLRYGRDRLRDLAGIVERVDAARWRLALPRPSFGGTLDLIELVPASAPPAAG